MFKKWLYYAISVAGLIVTMFIANVLNLTSSYWGLILLVSSAWLFIGGWTWIFIGRVGNNLRHRRLVQILSTVLIIIIIFVASPYYKDLFLITEGSIEMPEFGNDSTQVLVHYGRRANDIFWTQRTVGELKQNPSIALKINEQVIFNIYLEGRKVYVDALIFAGYGEDTVPPYTTIGSLSNFSIETSGYHKTDVVGKAFVIKTQPTLIKHKPLSPPVVIKNNDIDRLPNGWNKQEDSTALEITNEKNIPVLILKYENPYEIIISGLFVTPMGILKVDNSEDVVFELGDSLSELNAYKVDRIFINSFWDYFVTERTYILHN